MPFSRRKQACFRLKTKKRKQRKRNKKNNKTIRRLEGQVRWPKTLPKKQKAKQKNKNKNQ